MLATAAELDAKARGKAPIVALTEAARQRGIVPGMTATQGQARYADLHLCYRSAEDEDTARTRDAEASLAAIDHETGEQGEEEAHAPNRSLPADSRGQNLVILGGRLTRAPLPACARRSARGSESGRWD